ncbi:MAG: flagellar hook-associated protein FlgK [Phycisphaerales bacterium]|nr:flagellar hook-associated protein FlgK [Phycisphaerales bacterium]
MSLMGALNVGKSALTTYQAALQVTGNNIANAGNPDYTRQVASTATNKDQQYQRGIFLGTGVNLASVQRQIDEALESRVRSSISNSEGSDTLQQWLGRIESVYNELSDQDLSTQLSQFFNAWSNLANKPQDSGLRQVVTQTGQAVASWFQSIRTDFTNLQTDVDQRLAARAKDADHLAQQIADLNQQIVISEGGSGGQANGLRDQRDQILKQLSELMDIRTVEESSGLVNVYVGSQPLVMGTTNRGVDLRQETINGQLKTSVIFKADKGTIQLTSGEIGALNQVRSDYLQTGIEQIDQLAAGLINELNKLHTSGQGLAGFSSAQATSVVGDATVSLADPAADLDFVPANGSFVVHVKNKVTGQTSSTMVKVNLGGSGAQTSLNSLTADLDAIDNLSATVVGGQLKISADSANVEFSFSQDTSGALAALGINTFFSGSNARDIQVNTALVNSPNLLAASATGETGDNQVARMIAQLEAKPLTSLGGASLSDKYQAMVNGTAVAAAAARTNADAATTVAQTLQAQREALSGVSLDEEAINLIRQQRAFQGAARLVSAVDEMMKTILAMV